jgi:type II secretory pathway pseudopilin PulG
MSSEIARKRKNEAGFSLIAVMAIAAVIGMMAVLLVSVVTHMFRGGHHNVEEAATIVAANTAQALIGNATYCNFALRIKPGYTSSTTAPTGTSTMTFIKPAATGNTAEDARFDSIEFNGVPILWRGMTLQDYGAYDVTVDHMNISTTPGGIDFGRAGLNPIPYNFTYNPYNPGVVPPFTADAWPSYVNIWFAAPSNVTGLEVRSFPITILSHQNVASGAVATIDYCSGADGAAQICWELGGSLDPGQNYRCTNTVLQRLTGYSTGTLTCGPSSVTPGYDGCTPVDPGIAPPATTGYLDINTNPMPYGCAPVYSFIAISASGAPICACNAFCY